VSNLRLERKINWACGEMAMVLPKPYVSFTWPGIFYERKEISWLEYTEHKFLLSDNIRPLRRLSLIVAFACLALSERREHTAFKGEKQIMVNCPILLFILHFILEAGKMQDIALHSFAGICSHNHRASCIIGLWSARLLLRGDVQLSLAGRRAALSWNTSC
jgi:hypothetical protein